MSGMSQNIIKHKLGLLNLAQELGNISKACQVMEGIPSIDTGTLSNKEVSRH